MTPRADPTTAAVGHKGDAAVGEGNAIGVGLGDGVAATLELPQAESDAANRNAVRATRGLWSDTVQRCYLVGSWLGAFSVSAAMASRSATIVTGLLATASTPAGRSPAAFMNSPNPVSMRIGV